MSDAFYITTPIYYVNDVPHVGHAYTTIACDVAARYQRLAGKNVKFLTGTDEHGQKVDKSAAAAGKDPQAFTDEISQRFRHLVESGDNILNVTNTDFIRTTEERHKQAAQALWKKLEEAGAIYKDSYAGWYSVRDEAYYQESELVDGKAPTGAEVEWVEEESYFFKLSEYQDKLLELYKNQPDFVQPQSRLNEVAAFVDGGLKDLSISRTTFNWGVPVPGDDAHVMYVWIDALTNYLTSAGYPDIESEEYKTFWQSGPVHVIGKDILRFHAVYWPAFLMAAGLPLPKQIIAHGWWTIEGEKMSKSLGNVLTPDELIGKAGGIDQLRYFMLRSMPFGNDGDLSQDRLMELVNADLSNNIGNLAQRVLSMIQKNCDGKVPEYGELPEEDNQFFLNDAHKALDEYHAAMVNYQFMDGAKAVCGLASAANLYIDQQKPWILRKEDPERMKQVLYVLAETIRIITIMLQPFCPIAAAKALDALAVEEDKRNFAALIPEEALKPATPLPAPEPLFPRLEQKEAA